MEIKEFFDKHPVGNLWTSAIDEHNRYLKPPVKGLHPYQWFLQKLRLMWEFIPGDNSKQDE